MDFAHEGNFTAKKAGGIGITVAVHALVACGLLYGLQHTFTRTETPPVRFDPPKPQVHKEDPSIDKFKLPQDPTNTYHLVLPKIDITDPTTITPPKPGSSEPDGPTVDGPPKTGGGGGGGTSVPKLASAPLIANLDGCKPAYPRASLLNEESGVVRVKFVVGADNSLISASVLKSSGYTALDKAAVNGLSHCQFKAAVQDGVSVSSSFVTDYVWSLQNE
ncbi:MAG TPA: TonB family protein [Burkholderiaceae bacterium]|jgi:protein TonB|nr:TonB family protein [Burkholderiaceae bacterium]